MYSPSSPAHSPLCKGGAARAVLSARQQFERREFSKSGRESFLVNCPPAAERGFRRARQPRPSAQRLGIHHAGRQAQRPGAGDLRRTRSQARTGPRTPTAGALCGPEGCLMHVSALRSLSAWTEDRVTQRSNRSAVPGAETEERAVGLHAAAPSSLLRDRRQRDQPSTRRPLPRAHLRRSNFQLTVNQDAMPGRLV